MKILLSSLVCMVLLASCSNEYYSHRSVNIQRKDLLVTPVVADLSVDLSKKVTVESGKKNTVDAAKDEAYYKAVTENNIDVLVDPIYDITTTPKILFWGGKAKAKITGFGGKYTSVKKVNEAVNDYKIDTSAVKNFKILVGLGNETKNGSYFDQPVDAKKQNGIWTILIALAALKVL